MKRPGYREALDWMAGNDDCYWLADYETGDRTGSLSVSAAMVRDLFDVADTKLVADLRRALKRVHPDHEALRAT